MKKLICVLLTMLMLTICTVPAWAATTAETESVTLAPPPSTEQTDSQQSDDAWLLRIVNHENPIDETFAPEYEAIQGNFVMDKRVAPIMRQLIADALEEGVVLKVNSAYRPYDAQQRIFDERIAAHLSAGYSAEDATALTKMYVARPGYSEHQLGLAVDVVARIPQASGDYIVDYDGQWLAAHAPSYGFIMRYQADKTEITHAAYEPWHFRYVGETAAKEIAKEGLCLEEYLANLAAKTV